MSVIPQTMTPTTWTWPADVLAFADEHGLTACLEPFRQATLKLFPTMTELRVFVEADREFAEMVYIVFEAHVPNRDLDNHIALRHAWYEEWERLDTNRNLFKWILPSLIPVDE